MLRDALIVGISTYQNLPGLNAPAHDAEAIAYQLETYGDFRVVRLPEIVQAEKLKVGLKTPVTLAQLEAALVKLFKPSGSNVPHTALFYFSGHGLQKEAGIREGYLATSDTNPNAHFYGLSLFWLRRLLQESPVRQRIVLLDCCHSGEILNFLEADPGAKTGTDRLFMAASREYESAYEALSGDYSVFTQAVLQGLDPRRLASGVVTNYALTDWVSNALKGESQQPLFENSGSEVILTRCQNPPLINATSAVSDICPYRGLEPFGEGHAEYFFGRESLTDQLLERLRTKNFLAIVGASGSGKSSLVRAGLVHKLRRGQALSSSNHWQIRLLTPTEHPLKSLANAFIYADATPVERAEQLRRAEMFLQDGGVGLSQLIRASLMPEKNKHARLVMIIDQFEEVFTLCQGPHAERDRLRFFNCLLTAQQEISDRFSVVIVLRADFFSKCSLYKGLAEQIEHNLMMVTPLTYDQIKASILKPAEKVGLVCEPNLVYNILLDIVGAPGELPLLQYTLLELWHRRQNDPNGGASRLTLDAYTELGGVRGTLQKRADEIFYSLAPNEQQVAKRIFIALTQLGEGTEDTRRRVLKSELVNPQFPVDLVEQVLEKLVVSKLVVTNQVVPASGYQDQIDQRFANVSTALRLAQVLQSKSRGQLSTQIDSTALPHVQAALKQKSNLYVNRLSQVDVDLLQSLPSETCQETVDIAHEALIRNWALLRSWLDENREMLRRQRSLERAAREWQGAGQPCSAEYLLQGTRLIDAEDYLANYPNDLSILAQQFVSASREEQQRSRKELRMLQIVVPCTLLMALGITFAQHQLATKNEAEKDYQVQVATSRQWSAIAQSILQEPDGDPNTALLISRLAAERGRTYEAEASLRAALQKTRLQASLQAHQDSVEEIAFSPDHNRLAALEANGTIRLWSLVTQQIERTLTAKPGSAAAPTFSFLAFTPDGKNLIAIANNATQIQLWAVDSGQLVRTLEAAKPITNLVVSSDGGWIAVSSSDRTVQVWQTNTGRLHANLLQPGPITGLAFNSKNPLLLIASGTTVLLWDASTRQQKRILSHIHPVQSAVFSSGGQRVATVSEDGKVWIWDSVTGKIQQSLVPEAADQSGQRLVASQITFSPDDKRLAMATTSDQVWGWNLDNGQTWHGGQKSGKQVAHKKDRRAIAFSPDSQQLAMINPVSVDDSSRATVSIRNADTGQELGELRGHTGKINALHFSPDGSVIATASTDRSVHFWTADMGGELPVLAMAEDPIQWVAFQATTAQPQTLPNPAAASLTSNLPSTISLSATAQSIVAVANNGAVHQWEFVKNPSTTNMAAKGISNEASQFASASPGFNFINTLQQFQGMLSSWGSKMQGQLSYALSSSVGAQASNVIDLVQENGPAEPMPTMVKTHQALTTLIKDLPLGTKLTSVVFSQAAGLVAIADNRGGAEIWKLENNQTLSRVHLLQAASPLLSQISPVTELDLSNHPRVMRQLAFSQDGQKLLGVGVDRILRIWEVSSGKLIHEMAGHEAFVEQAQFSPDGNRIVSASWDRTARIWDVLTGKLLTTLSHPDSVTSAHYSPDGQRVVTTSLDGTAKVLNATTGTLQVILAGHRGAVLDAEFSPNGAALVTASADGTARLWDAATGVEKTLLRSVRADNGQEAIKRAFFSPDGQYIATLNSNGKLRLWAATWQGLLQLARDRSLRQLKPEECLRYLRLAPNLCPQISLNSGNDQKRDSP